LAEASIGEAEIQTLDDHELMHVRADTLFTYDARKRMMRTNERVGRPAPRLFCGRTPGGHVVRIGEGMPVDMSRRVGEIFERRSLDGALRFSPAVLAEVREVLETHGRIAAEGGGPAYRFPASIEPHGEVVHLTDANRALVRDTFPWLFNEFADWQPCFAIARAGAAVSVCFSSRNGVRAAEAGVETLPDYRGRGYAVALTAAWGAAIRAEGRVPLYSTAWDNHVSQAVARRAGLILFGTDATWA
jgi:hypothetical protein